jgi:hypothetical protein
VLVSFVDDKKTLDQSDYTIQYPSSWDLDQSGQFGSTFFLFSPISSEQDRFRENISLIIQDLSAYNLSLEEYVNLSKDQVKSMITNSSAVDTKTMKAKGREYAHITYTGDQGEFSLHFDQYVWLINKKAYIITFTTQQSTFEEFKTGGFDVMNSFVIK